MAGEACAPVDSGAAGLAAAGLGVEDSAVAGSVVNGGRHLFMRTKTTASGVSHVENHSFLQKYAGLPLDRPNVDSSVDDCVQ